MAQYQSFPDAAGDSQTLDKLRTLKLPDLAGRSFLDVGCNEGFFCGFASNQGASRSLGIDHSKLFIERARQRFPDAEFRCQDWEQLPEGEFDVILLASALHYAEDQAALIQRLIEKLAPDGMLVLELGIASSKAREWVNVKRGIDDRQFPSMPMLRHLLRHQAWKWMGPSVSQDGDPVPRHVVHISHRRPVAYLLLQPPAYGKTSIAARLFRKARIPVVSGDELINRIAKGTVEAPEVLRDTIRQEFSPFRIDQAIQRIFDRGLVPELVALWLEKSGGADFAVDMYVPESHKKAVERALTDQRYLPVRLEWDRPGPSLLPAAAFEEQVEHFYRTMAPVDGPGEQRVPGSRPAGSRGGLGFVDEVSLGDGRMYIRGWAIDIDNTLPAALCVRIRGKSTDVPILDKRRRADVQRHLGLEHDQVGYQISLAMPADFTLSSLAKGFEVSIPRGASLQFAGPIASLIGGRDAPPAVRARRRT